MVGCKIQNCPIKRGECTMFSVPFEPITRKIWIDIIEKYQEFDYIPMVFPLCELHFDASDIIRYGKRTKLQSGAVPKYFENLDFDRLNRNEPNKNYNPKKKHKKSEGASEEIEPNFDFVSVESIVKNEPDAIPLEYEYNDLVSESLSVCDASTQTEDVAESPNGKCHGSTSTESAQSQRLPQSKMDTANISSNENEVTVCISQREYARLLLTDLECIKANEKINRLKLKCQAKAKEVKQLQDSLSYHKKKLSELTKHSQQE
ncbi:uncharacterized protein LOC129575133 isoform X1 [Sitodiplosis mosellana]|uniref:uncharacterized protein LOC129575133 isoform X1 n=1 Tax=Sitodiplosis mosellana TaxID=263140 RepID=UPI0024442C8B|nr:uncharacterized protein LOC129575133 isoform X1 [Sitodiplosis mosellana]